MAGPAGCVRENGHPCEVLILEMNRNNGANPLCPILSPDKIKHRRTGSQSGRKQSGRVLE
jgi:hypothetical protein